MEESIMVPNKPLLEFESSQNHQMSDKSEKINDNPKSNNDENKDRFKDYKTKNSEKFQIGKWNKDECLRFMEAISLYGKNWKKIQEYVGTRSITQIRSHAQKFLPNPDSSTPIKSKKPSSPAEKIETAEKTIEKEINVVSKKCGSRIKFPKPPKNKKLESEIVTKRSDYYQEHYPLLVKGAYLPNTGNYINTTAEQIANENESYQKDIEMGNRNEGQEFEFDFSEIVITPLHLEEREPKNTWKNIESDEEAHQNLLT